jgi:outer membrane protein assembly factor BamB
MRRATTILLFLASAAFASRADWSTVGGNNEHNGYNDWPGPWMHEVRWEAQALPATISLQAYVWDTLVVTGRYLFSPMSITLVCHDLHTGETLWTRQHRAGGKLLPFGFCDGRVYCRNFRETGHDTIFCIDGYTGDILWQSDWTAPLGIIWCGCFAADGDLITPCAERGIARLDRETGDTVWTNNRPIPNTGAEWIAMSDTIVYAWEGQGINRPKYLIAISANTGRTFARSAELPGDGDQELPFVVGPGHVVYCQRDGGLFYAMQLSDTTFVPLWTRSDVQGSVWQNYGVGPDSTVYVPIEKKLYRLSPADGSILNWSPELVTGGNVVPRVSIAHAGYLFVMATTGQGEGVLWCLTRDLDSVWREDYGYSYYSGPAIGRGGIMVVPAAGTAIKAYQPSLGVADSRPVRPIAALTATPNPFSSSVLIHWTAGPLDRSTAPLRIFDSSGRLVRVLSGSPAIWDGRDVSGRPLHAGAYFCRSGDESVRLVLAE